MERMGLSWEGGGGGGGRKGRAERGKGELGGRGENWGKG